MRGDTPATRDPVGGGGRTFAKVKRRQGVRRSAYPRTRGPGGVNQWAVTVCSNAGDGPQLTGLTCL
jgi:hypothetical protein